MNFKFDAANSFVTYKPLIIVSTVVYLVLGYFVFLYLPSRAAKRALRKAKTRQLEIIAEQYNLEQKALMEKTEQGLKDPQAKDFVKDQIEKLKLLNETTAQIEKIPNSLISRRLIRIFGLSYITIYLPILAYNLIRAFVIPGNRTDFFLMLQICSFPDKFQGLISILITGSLGNIVEKCQ